MNATVAVKVQLFLLAEAVMQLVVQWLQNQLESHLTDNFPPYIDYEIIF